MAVALYGLVITSGGLLFNAIWMHANRARLFDAEVTAQGVRRVTKHILFGPAMYALGALILFYWLPIPQRDAAGIKVGTR